MYCTVSPEDPGNNIKNIFYTALIRLDLQSSPCFMTLASSDFDPHFEQQGTGLLDSAFNGRFLINQTLLPPKSRELHTLALFPTLAKKLLKFGLVSQSPNRPQPL